MRDDVRCQHRNPNAAAFALAIVASVGLAVWAFSEMHSDNRVLDAIPATASLARDLAVGLVMLAWLPLVAIAVVVGVGVLIVAVGRASMGRPALPAGPARAQPAYRTVVR